MADFRQELEGKLRAARKRATQGKQVKALKESAPALFEVIDGEITLIVNTMTADKPLSYDEYLDKHGQVKGIMRIRNLLDSKEAEADATIAEVEAIQNTIKQFDDDKK